MHVLMQVQYIVILGLIVNKERVNIEIQTRGWPEREKDYIILISPHFHHSTHLNLNRNPCDKKINLIGIGYKIVDNVLNREIYI